MASKGLIAFMIILLLMLAVACGSPDGGSNLVNGDAQDDPGESDPLDDPQWLDNPNWVTEEVKEAWHEQHGSGTWVVNFLYPLDFYYPPPPQEPSDFLRPFWIRVSEEGLELDREEKLRLSLETMLESPTADEGNAWYGMLTESSPTRGDLDLVSAELNGSELTLDFGSELPRDGVSNPRMVILTDPFIAIASHYFPEAKAVCLLVNGEPGVWFEMVHCHEADSH